MNMMPGFAPKPGDLTRHDPSLLPWVIIAEKGTGKTAIIINAANEPIGTLEANSHTQLVEIANLIEQAFRERDQLLDEGRFHADQTRRKEQRRF